jgi:hypothetical protein
VAADAEAVAASVAKRSAVGTSGGMTPPSELVRLTGSSWQNVADFELGLLPLLSWCDKPGVLRRVEEYPAPVEEKITLISEGSEQQEDTSSRVEGTSLQPPKSPTVGFCEICDSREPRVWQVKVGANGCCLLSITVVAVGARPNRPVGLAGLGEKPPSWSSDTPESRRGQPSSCKSRMSAVDSPIVGASLCSSQSAISAI